MARSAPESTCNGLSDVGIIQKPCEHEDQSSRGLDFNRVLFPHRLGMVRYLRREVAQSACADDDRHRAHPQCRRVRASVYCFGCRQLHIGDADLAVERDNRIVRSQNRARLLVRVLVHRIRDHFRVLRL